MDTLSVALSIISLVVGGAISLFIAKHFTLKSGIKVQINSISIFDNNEVLNNKIDIIVNNIKVERLVKSSIKIWNSGKQTIKGEEIVKTNPICAVFPKNTNIFHVSIEKNTDKDMQFEAIANGNQVEIKFEYCQPNNGVRIEILHDAEAKELNFQGKIKTINPKNFIVNHINKKWYKRSLNTFFVKVYRIGFPIICMVLFVLLSIAGSLLLYTTNIIKTQFGGLIPILILMLLGAVSPYVYKFIKSLISSDDGPADLD